MVPRKETSGIDVQHHKAARCCHHEAPRPEQAQQGESREKTGTHKEDLLSVYDKTARNSRQYCTTVHDTCAFACTVSLSCTCCLHVLCCAALRVAPRRACRIALIHSFIHLTRDAQHSVAQARCESLYVCAALALTRRQESRRVRLEARLFPQRSLVRCVRWLFPDVVIVTMTCTSTPPTSFSLMTRTGRSTCETYALWQAWWQLRSSRQGSHV